MTIQGIQIDGQGTFNDVTENSGVVTTAVFAGSATNSGTVSLSAEFGDDSANHGEVTQVAVFAGNAVNTGTVAVAEFRDTAMNAGTVSTSATFADTSVNTGTVAEAFFADSAVNDGGTVTGNAVFADTSVNSGTVEGDAEVAATATNSGTVQGNTSEYVPPVVFDWYDDTSSAARAVTLNGTVTQSDEGNGVKAALFDTVDGSDYITIDGSNLSNVTGDFTLEFFVYPITTSGYQEVISLGSYAQGALLRSRADGGEDILWVRGNLVLVGNSNLHLNFGAWNHVALVRESDAVTYYVNGSSVANATISEALNFSTIALGTIVDAIGANLYGGKLANIRLVIGSNVYSGTPTSIPTNISGTELLLNFGATAVPTV